MDAWTLDSTTNFVYDGWNLIRETTTTDAGNSTDHYVWGLDLSGSLQGASGPSTSLRTGIGGLLLRNTDSGSYLYLYDANGNVGQLVNAANGAIAPRITNTIRLGIHWWRMAQRRKTIPIAFRPNTSC